jgi:two-component system, sensor histidine kinase LadS
MSQVITHRSALGRLRRYAAVCLLLLAGTSALAAETATAYLSPGEPSHGTRPLIDLSTHHGSIKLGGISEYLLDDDLAATVEQIEARASLATPKAPLFRPYGADTVRIIDARVLWIRFDAVNKDQQTRWLLEVYPPTVDEATLFWRNEQGRWTKQVAGDHIASTDWPMPTRVPAFLLDSKSQSPVTYYMRIVHDRVPLAAPIQLISGSELLAEEQRESFWLGCYFGLALLMLVIGLINAWLQEDDAFAKYALYMAALALTHAVSTGLGAQYLWPTAVGWNRVADFLMPSAALATGLLLMRSALMPQRTAPLLDLAALGVTVIQVSVTVFDTLWPSTWGFLLANSAALVALLTMGMLLWLTVQRAPADTFWMVAGFAPLVVASVFPVLRNFGLLSSGFLSQYATMVATAFSAPVLLFALFARVSQRRISRVRTAALMQSDPLTGLTNDRSLMQNLHGSLMRAERYRHQFALVLVELSNLDWFHREHGRLIGDRALLLLATRLSGVARNVDTAARLQDNLFALLIEGPASSAQAVQAATQILSRSLRPSEQLPVGASLKVQITAALMPDPQSLDFGEDANACLNWLVAHTADSHEVPRKAIRTINF